MRHPRPGSGGALRRRSIVRVDEFPARALQRQYEYKALGRVISRYRFDSIARRCLEERPAHAPRRELIADEVLIVLLGSFATGLRPESSQDERERSWRHREVDHLSSNDGSKGALERADNTVIWALFEMTAERAREVLAEGRPVDAAFDATKIARLDRGAQLRSRPQRPRCKEERGEEEWQDQEFPHGALTSLDQNPMSPTHVEIVERRLDMVLP